MDDALVTAKKTFFPKVHFLIKICFIVWQNNFDLVAGKTPFIQTDDVLLRRYGLQNLPPLLEGYFESKSIQEKNRKAVFHSGKII